MLRLTRTAGAVAGLAIVATALPAPAYNRPGPTTLIVRSDLTGKAPKTGSSEFQRISDDGRYVAYDSTSSDIVAGDTNVVSDVFEWDRVTGKTTRVSVASNGLQGVPAKVDASHPLPQGSMMGDVSADGRYVVFSSDDTNLVVGDTNLAVDVFVHDRVTKTTRRASVSSSGAQADGGTLNAATISGNGRYVAFLSAATNLVPGDTNNLVDAFVHDMVTGRTTRVSDNATGASSAVAISADGRYAAWSTAGTTDTPAQAWVRDLRNGSERRADIAAPGISPPAQTPLLGGAAVAQDGISADGRYVLFSSSDTYVPAKTTRAYVSNTPAIEFYRHDFATGRTERVTVTSAGEQRDGGVYTTAHMSPDGRFVAFDSRGDFTSLTGAGPCTDVSGLTCPNRHAYLRDMQLGSTELVGWTYAGKPAATGFAEGAMWASVSASGRYVAFLTNSESMYPGQPARGQPGDSWWTYLRDRGPVIGVSGLAATGALTVAGDSTFGRSGIVGRVDARDDVSPALTALGANISAGSVVYRPATADLYLRIQLEQMPTYDAVAPGLVYACHLTVNGIRYDVRATKSALGPSFELLRAGAAGWARVARLRGGYGTTGAEVVAALPLRLIGAASGARISDVGVAAALGTTTDGALSSVVDRLDL